MDLSSATEAHLDIFNTIERVCSVFSLIGCTFIIATFCVSKSFHKPINRLVFYASLYVRPFTAVRRYPVSSPLARTDAYSTICAVAICCLT